MGLKAVACHSGKSQRLNKDTRNTASNKSRVDVGVAVSAGFKAARTKDREKKKRNRWCT